MFSKKSYINELKNYAKKVEKDNKDLIFGSEYANLIQNQHTMLLEGRLSNFNFKNLIDEDFEKVELYDYSKGENGRTS